jgi:hypothetical protein
MIGRLKPVSVFGVDVFERLPLAGGVEAFAADVDGLDALAQTFWDQSEQS